VPARAAALLAVASAGVHLAAVDAASLTSLAMAGMALACLPCAWHLWRAPTASVWGLTVVVDLGMLAVHAPMLAVAGPSADGHVHTTAAHTGPMWAGVGLVTASLLLGLAVLARTALRTRAPRFLLPADGEETARP
jgi:hypothetical protein